MPLLEHNLWCSSSAVWSVSYIERELCKILWTALLLVIVCITCSNAMCTVHLLWLLLASCNYANTFVCRYFFFWTPLYHCCIFIQQMLVFHHQKRMVWWSWYGQLRWRFMMLCDPVEPSGLRRWLQQPNMLLFYSRCLTSNAYTCFGATFNFVVTCRGSYNAVLAAVMWWHVTKAGLQCRCMQVLFFLFCYLLCS